VKDPKLWNVLAWADKLSCGHLSEGYGTKTPKIPSLVDWMSAPFP